METGLDGCHDSLIAHVSAAWALLDWLPKMGRLKQKHQTKSEPTQQQTSMVTRVLQKNSRENLTPMWHIVGTCSMLPRERDADCNLSVYGIEGLRAVDASVIQLISTPNIQATVYAFAERAAELIKRD